MEKIQIKPIQLEVTEIEITNVSVNLDKSANINVFYYLKDGRRPVKNFSLDMDGETYDAWGNDDEYVVNWVLSQLGLEKK